MLKGTAWILGLVFGLVLGHRIPTHPFHGAILRGLVPYLLLFNAGPGHATHFRMGCSTSGELWLHSLLPGLYVDGRRDEQAVWRDWEMLLTPRGQKASDDVSERVSDELALADLAMGRALELRKLGSVDEALEVLDAGYALIERFSPSMRTFLAGSRCSPAWWPPWRRCLPSARGTPRSAAFAGLAYLDQLLHQFLVTTAERFRLRVFIVGRGFVVAARFLLKAKQRVDRRQPAVEAARGLRGGRPPRPAHAL